MAAWRAQGAKSAFRSPRPEPRGPAGARAPRPSGAGEGAGSQRLGAPAACRIRASDPSEIDSSLAVRGKYFTWTGVPGIEPALPLAFSPREGMPCLNFASALVPWRPFDCLWRQSPLSLPENTCPCGDASRGRLGVCGGPGLRGAGYAVPCDVTEGRGGLAPAPGSLPRF